MIVWMKEGLYDTWMGGFNTIGQCIADAKEIGISVGDTITIGSTCEFQPFVVVEDVLRCAEDMAVKLCGDVAEDWIIPTNNNDAYLRLDRKLCEALHEYLADVDSMPEFCRVCNWGEVVVV